MTEPFALAKVAAALLADGASETLETLFGPLDAGKKGALDAAIQNYVLEELPRLKRLLLERDLMHSTRCTPSEVLMIVHQVLQAQSETLDPEKQARLTNVAINGFDDVEWSMARHRLFVRVAAEVETEHVAILREFEDRPGTRAKHLPYPQTRTTSPSEEEIQRRDAQLAKNAVKEGLSSELVSAGLLREEQAPGQRDRPFGRRGFEIPEDGVRPVTIPADDYKNLEIDARVALSPLGRQFLVFLRDPDAKAG